MHLLNTEQHIRSYSEVSAACAVVSMLDATCECSVFQKAARSKGALRLIQHVPMSLLHCNIFRASCDNMYDVVVCGQVTPRAALVESKTLVTVLTLTLLTQNWCWPCVAVALQAAHYQLCCTVLTMYTSNP